MSFRIALVGPDGTGKSTIAQRLMAELPEAKYIYMGINQDASNVVLPTTWLMRRFRRLRRKNNSMGGPPPISNNPPSGKKQLWSTVKAVPRIANLIGEEWYREFVGWLARRRGKLVIMDRHFFLDYFAYDVQPRYGTRNFPSRFHGWMLRRLYPRPDFVIFLDGDPELLYARKKEGSVEQLQRRREEYMAARPLFPDSVVIDVAQPLDDVVAQALTAIREFQHRRTQRPNDGPPSGELRSAVPPPKSDSHSRQNSPTTSTAPVVVVGLDCYTGLQTARVLHERGIQVIGIAENTNHFACRSRACRQIIGSPTRTHELIRNLETLGAKLGRQAVLVPCIDMSVMLISQHRQRLEKYFRFALPPHACVETLLDKSTFYQFAEKHGFPIPASFNVTSRDEAIAAAEHLEFPCLVKPAVKTDQWERKIKTKIFRARDREELLDIVARGLEVSPILTVQQWIDGEDCDLFTCNCYFDEESKPLVTFTSQKLRQWPARMGVASLAQECRNDEVTSLTINLFQAARFHGLGYLEVKRDRRTGKYYCIEANVGRPTGRSALAEAAGVELLQTMYCDLLDAPLPAARQQRYRNVKWIYLRKDLCAAYYYWRRGELTLTEWWRSLRGPKATAVFSWRDPLPALLDLFGVAGKKRKVTPQPSSTTGTELVGPSAANP